MSNRLQYIAVKNDYYSGKPFNPASAYNTYLDMNNSELVLFLMAWRVVIPRIGFRFSCDQDKSIWKRNLLQKSI